jgi:hypothetical protein
VSGSKARLAAELEEAHAAEDTLRRILSMPEHERDAELARLQGLRLEPRAVELAERQVLRRAEELLDGAGDVANWQRRRGELLADLFLAIVELRAARGRSPT